MQLIKIIFGEVWTTQSGLTERWLILSGIPRVIRHWKVNAFSLLKYLTWTFCHSDLHKSKGEKRALLMIYFVLTNFACRFLELYFWEGKHSEIRISGAHDDRIIIFSTFLNRKVFTKFSQKDTCTSVFKTIWELI